MQTFTHPCTSPHPQLTPRRGDVHACISSLTSTLPNLQCEEHPNHRWRHAGKNSIGTVGSRSRRTIPRTRGPTKTGHVLRAFPQCWTLQHADKICLPAICDTGQHNGTGQLSIHHGEQLFLLRKVPRTYGPRTYGSDLCTWTWNHTNVDGKTERSRKLKRRL
jgi:hypothetical protein